MDNKITKESSRYYIDQCVKNRLNRECKLLSNPNAFNSLKAVFLMFNLQIKVNYCVI